MEKQADRGCPQKRAEGVDTHPPHSIPSFAVGNNWPLFPWRPLVATACVLAGVWALMWLPGLRSCAPGS